MTRHKACKKIEELLTPYLLGDLPAAQAEEIQRHVETCERCRASLQELKPTLDILQDALAANAMAPIRLDPKRRARVRQRPSKGSFVEWVSRPVVLANAAAVLVLCGLLSLLVGPAMQRTGGRIVALSSAPIAADDMIVVHNEIDREDFDAGAWYSRDTRGAMDSFGAFGSKSERAPGSEDAWQRRLAEQRGYTYEEAEALGTVDRSGGAHYTDQKAIKDNEPMERNLSFLARDHGVKVDAVRAAKLSTMAGQHADGRVVIGYEVAGGQELPDSIDELDLAVPPAQEVSSTFSKYTRSAQFNDYDRDRVELGKHPASVRYDVDFVAASPPPPAAPEPASGPATPSQEGEEFARLGDLPALGVLWKESDVKNKPVDAPGLARVRGRGVVALGQSLDGATAERYEARPEIREQVTKSLSLVGGEAAGVAGGVSLVEAETAVGRQVAAQPAGEIADGYAVDRYFFNGGTQVSQPAWELQANASQGVTEFGVVAAGSDSGAASTEYDDLQREADEGKDEMLFANAHFGWVDMSAEGVQRGEAGEEATTREATRSSGLAPVDRLASYRESNHALSDMFVEAEFEEPALLENKRRGGMRFLATDGETFEDPERPSKGIVVDDSEALSELSQGVLRAGESEPQDISLRLYAGLGNDKGRHIERVRTFAETAPASTTGRTSDGLEAGDVLVSSLVLEEAQPAPARIQREPAAKPVFKAWGVNPFVTTRENRFSTFGIDVDTASYTLARKHLLAGFLPPAEAVRTEEFVNFFDHGYRAPARSTFAIYTDFAPAPFGEGYLLKIGVKGRRLGREEQRRAALTFVIDTSGSMDTPDRLGLIQQSLRMLVDQLSPEDTVALVQYDSRARLTLDPTPASQRERILDVVDNLQTSGSTHLEEGLRLGYQVAARGFDGAAMNRVLLLSDGMANMGSAEAEPILDSVEAYREQGVYCSVFGFGRGTYNDLMLETLANKGDGTYQFIDSLDEARRVFVDDLAATLNVIASDVKIQVEFDPAHVERYRQLGYENRQLKAEDFRNDTVDAGEVGSGQSVTALYELLPTGTSQKALGTVRVRYRNTETAEIEEISKVITAGDLRRDFTQADVRFRLAASVAEFAEVLRGSPFAEGSSYEDVARVLRPVALELSLDQRVQELLRLVQSATGMPRAAE